MRYVSTRAQDPTQTASFTEILLEGLAPDGGLYLPAEYPQVDRATLDDWRTTLNTQGYAALAHKVVSLYIDDIPGSDLLGICQRAYTEEKFGTPDIVPTTRLSNDLFIGHLSNGPSAAFKDMAMQLLGELFAYELGRQGRSLNILGATSGDTGSSAEYAMMGKPGVRVFMLTPAGRMTPFQQAQMFSIQDPAIINMAVDGVFDDCQDIVKSIGQDAAFKAKYSIGAVNSINWARVLAQVVYYVALWIRCTDEATQKVSFSVPTGNFGNILAGHVARMMGVPIDRLILATNENNVLEDFFKTGLYKVRSREETWATSSPSMDISKASNFERFVCDMLGRDTATTAKLFGPTLSKAGSFHISEGDTQNVQPWEETVGTYGFMTGSSTHADRIATIQEIHTNFGVTIDPHTADAMRVALNQHKHVKTPIVVLETALPVKFQETIVEALGAPPVTPARFEGIEDRPRTVINIDNDPHQVRAIIEKTCAR
ncbi:MAG: threonine synthase [Actinomycetaceae bacterium]|nr:threonine synthase [Actinomycetaceae bacterium]